MSSPLRRALTLFLPLLLVCAALVAWWVRAQPRTTPADEVPPVAAPAVPVVLGSVTRAEDTARLDVLGSGMAAHSVTLFTAVPGEVAEVRFRPGQRVQANDVLLRLVDRQQRLAVDLAAARLEAARRLLKRYEVTRGTGAVPGSVIDEAESGVRLAEIELRQARENLADRVLRAPFAGVVGIAEVEPGDRVGTDTPITTLDDRTTLKVAFDVPEAYAARLRPGQALAVSTPAYGDRRFEGTVAQIDSRIDPVSRSLRLRANVPNPEDLLRPGMSFQVQLELPGEPRPAVPELAVQWGREGAYVWVVRDGEAVVVEGVQRLRPGRAVAPVGGAAVSLAPGASR